MFRFMLKWYETHVYAQNNFCPRIEKGKSKKTGDTMILIRWYFVKYDLVNSNKDSNISYGWPYDPRVPPTPFYSSRRTSPPIQMKMVPSLTILRSKTPTTTQAFTMMTQYWVSYMGSYN